MTSTTQLEPANQHRSVDLTSTTESCLDPVSASEPWADSTVTSEPLCWPAAEASGWAQFVSGDEIGQGNRYTIVRKLGRGMYSSTWLARDNIDHEFVAVKALTGHATRLNRSGLVREAEALRLISRPPTSPHCTQLLDEFTTPGKGSTGPHLCFVMPVYGGDVKALINARKTPLPFPLVKRIVLHLLRGIVHSHKHGMVHTDIKPDNIFFSTTMTAGDIRAWVMKEPLRRHAPEPSRDGVVKAAVSQPLPMISEAEAMRATYVLADFGCAQRTKIHDHHTITPLALRPPEVYLGAAWDKPVDIWTFGCVIFELVTSQHLFRYQRNTKFDLDETENMLYQMMLHTAGDLFSAEQLQISPNSSKYFNEDCDLRKDPEVFDWPIKARIDELKVVSDEEATATANLIGRCLLLDPEERPTAAELLSDPWFVGVEASCTPTRNTPYPAPACALSADRPRGEKCSSSMPSAAGFAFGPPGVVASAEARAVRMTSLEGERVKELLLEIFGAT